MNRKLIGYGVLFEETAINAELFLVNSPYVVIGNHDNFKRIWFTNEDGRLGVGAVVMSSVQEIPNECAVIPNLDIEDSWDDDILTLCIDLRLEYTRPQWIIAEY